MPDHLPHRAFTPLPPPPAGPAAAVRRGRALRRRRRLAGTGAAAVSMALVAGVVIASGPGSEHASDQLIPARPDVRQPTAGPSGGHAQRALVAAAPGAAHPAAGIPAASPRVGASGRPRQTATAQPTQPARSGYRTPTLTRSYAAPPPTAARICEASVTTDSQGTRKRIDWCITPKVTTTDAGHDLSVVVCRDRTADSTLTYGRNLEADLAIEHGGKTLWRWSAGHPSVQDTHSLATPAGACWSWTAAWTDVDHTGRPLPLGSYDLVVLSLADQVSELPEERTTFRIS